jgi:hypothetical protein
MHRREDGQTADGKSFISLRRNSIAFNAQFIRSNKLANCTRAKVYLDPEDRKVGFLFHSEISDRDSFAMTTDGGGKKGLSRLIQVQSVMVKNRWLRVASELKDGRSRQYVPIKLPDGKWVISIRPSFEVEVLRKHINQIPEDLTGIYRYLDGENIVYIGRGSIRSRLAASERSTWVFDRIQFSPVEDQNAQEMWESEWIEEYRSNLGYLPNYNRIGGRKNE